MTITFEMHFMNTNISKAKKEANWMSGYNEILSIFLVYKSMPTLFFTKWIQSLKNIYVCMCVYIPPNTQSRNISKLSSFSALPECYNNCHPHSHANITALLH